jgi:hypothetical protein
MRLPLRRKIPTGEGAFDPPMPSLQLQHGSTKLTIAPGDTVTLGSSWDWKVVDPQHPGWTIDNWPRKKP